MRWRLDGSDGSDGGSPVTGYIIRPYVNGVAKTVVRVDGRKNMKVTIEGLKRGAKYRFRIAAVNAVGVGYNSATTKPVKIR